MKRSHSFFCFLLLYGFTLLMSSGAWANSQYREDLNLMQQMLKELETVSQNEIQVSQTDEDVKWLQDQVGTKKSAIQKINQEQSRQATPPTLKSHGIRKIRVRSR